MADKQLPAMWRLFWTIMVLGALGGVLSPLVLALLSGGRRLPGIAAWALGVVLGLAYSFVVYAYVKSVLRAFVRKLHTLERFVAGTTPPPLPPAWSSNEIDEVERSAARIIARLDAQRAEAGS